MPHTDHAHSRDRHVYLLSLWQEGRTWRAALRPADGGPRKGFGDLEQLVAFLRQLQETAGKPLPIQKEKGTRDDSLPPS
jgi:hypothetical protein